MPIKEYAIINMWAKKNRPYEKSVVLNVLLER
jgi:hypothetical protein